MKMVKAKTSELIGAQLNWAVAKAAGHEPGWFEKNTQAHTVRIENKSFDPSGNWSDGGPIVGLEICTLYKRNCMWTAECFFPKPPDKNRFCYEGKGETALIASMRAFAVSRLGGVVEVPES